MLKSAEISDQRLHEQYLQIQPALSVTRIKWSPHEPNLAILTTNSKPNMSYNQNAR